MEKKTLFIPKISCGHCTSAIENELGEIKGVLSAKGDILAKTVTVEWEKPVTLQKIMDILKETGYPVAE
ncbi:MAG: heavy-metal-associated domain-containing protein [Desulfococcaceae bacterium]